MGEMSEGGKKEILYNGYFYSIGDFISRHPGGALIEFYVNNSEDATQAIQQFHHRSAKRVQAILSSFPRRKATEGELIGSRGSEKAARHRALSEDFEKLYRELIDEGFFQPSLSHVLLRYLEISSVAIFGLWLFSHGWTAAGIACISIGCGRSGWFVHEGGHISLTGRPGVDRWIQSHIYGVFCGLSGASWRNHHSKHHAMPQHLHNDIDMQTLPIMAFHKRAVQDPKAQFSFLIKYQKWLIYVVQSSILGFYWKYYEDPIYAWKNGYYWDLLWMGLHQLFILKLGLPLYILTGCIAMSYLVLNSTLSHTHLPITEEPTHWVEYSLVHTANVRSSWWVDYFMGYLNYQIEHHLFPAMPQFRNKLAAKRVKALAAKHGLPYHLYDYQTILKLTMDNLGKVSEEIQAEIQANQKETETKTAWDKMQEEDSKEPDWTLQAPLKVERKFTKSVSYMKYSIPER